MFVYTKNSQSQLSSLINLKKIERKMKLFNKMIRFEVEFRYANRKYVLAGTAAVNA